MCQLTPKLIYIYENKVFCTFLPQLYAKNRYDWYSVLPRYFVVAVVFYLKIPEDIIECCSNLAA